MMPWIFFLHFCLQDQVWNFSFTFSSNDLKKLRTMVRIFAMFINLWQSKWLYDLVGWTTFNIRSTIIFYHIFLTFWKIIKSLLSIGRTFKLPYFISTTITTIKVEHYNFINILSNVSVKIHLIGRWTIFIYNITIYFYINFELFCKEIYNWNTFYIYIYVDRIALRLLFWWL